MMQDANGPSSTSSEHAIPSLLYGLDVLSLEAPTYRQRRSFARLSDRLQRGESLDSALAAESRTVPPYLRRLLSAPIPSDKLGQLVERYIQNCQRSQDIYRQIVTSLIYPTILVVFTCGILYFLLGWAVPPFKKIFEDFGTELPGITVTLINLSDAVLVWRFLLVVAFVIVPAVVIWYLLLLIGGTSGRRFVLNSVPAFGTAFRYGSLAQFCDLLAVLIEFRVPLPEALRLAGDGANDRSLRSASEQLAQAAESGVPLEEAAANLPEFPPLATHVFRWSDRQAAFTEGLEAAADVFASQTQLQTGLLRVVMEPLVFAFIAITVGFFLTALFMPLIKLLNDLS